MVGLQGDNAEKNRYSTVLPTESSRVLLLPIDEIESSTYINAVYVDSYKQKNAFILTQSPLPQTVIDFWRMVSEHGISSIVMLNAIDEGEVENIICIFSFFLLIAHFSSLSPCHLVGKLDSADRWLEFFECFFNPFFAISGHLIMVNLVVDYSMI